MNTETLQINLAKKIFSIRDMRLLKKIDALLNDENTMIYDFEGNAFSEKEFIKELDAAILEMESGKDSGKSPDEVYKSINDAYNLG